MLTVVTRCKKPHECVCCEYHVWKYKKPVPLPSPAVLSETLARLGALLEGSLCVCLMLCWFQVSSDLPVALAGPISAVMACVKYGPKQMTDCSGPGERSWLPPRQPGCHPLLCQSSPSPTAVPQKCRPDPRLPLLPAACATARRQDFQKIPGSVQITALL